MKRFLKILFNLKVLKDSNGNYVIRKGWILKKYLNFGDFTIRGKFFWQDITDTDDLSSYYQTSNFELVKKVVNGFLEVKKSDYVEVDISSVFESPPRKIPQRPQWNVVKMTDEIK